MYLNNDKRSKEFIYIIDPKDNKHFGKIITKNKITGDLKPELEPKGFEPAKGVDSCRCPRPGNPAAGEPAPDCAGESFPTGRGDKLHIGRSVGQSGPDEDR